MDAILTCDHSNESHQAVNFPVAVLFILLNNVITFESVNEILKCGYSCESYQAVFSSVAVFYAVHTRWFYL